VDLVVISLRALLSSVGALAGQAVPGDTVPGDTVPGDNVPGHVVEAELDGEHEG
jgi:hypothetical protein